MTRLDLDFSKFSTAQIIERHEGVHLDAWAGEILAFLKSYSCDNTFDCFTSGTTGTPKKYSLTKGQLQYSAKATLRFFNLQEGDSVLLSLSVHFIAGKMMLVRAIEGKLKLTVVAPCSNPFKYLKKDDKFVFTPLVPLQLHEIFESSAEIHQLGKLLIGGGSVHENLIKKLQQNKINAWSSFGMTETITHFALQKLSPTGDDFYECLPDFSVNTNEERCLLISNSVLFEKPIETKDIVQLSSPTKFRWLGRLDNMINSGGIKISPEIIEQKLKELIPVDFIISSLFDEKLGQKLVLIYKRHSFEFNVEVQTKIKSQLTAFEFPKEFIPIDDFPRTASGKIIRKDIKI